MVTLISYSYAKLAFVIAVSLGFIAISIFATFGFLAVSLSPLFYFGTDVLTWVNTKFYDGLIMLDS
jgi:hypothetical protein